VEARAAPEAVLGVVDHGDAGSARENVAEPLAERRRSGERAGGEYAPQPRTGRDAAPDLLEQQRGFRKAVAGPTRLLGERETEPAKGRRLAPERLVDGRLGHHHLPDAGGCLAIGEDATDGVADRFLLGTEGQIHVAPQRGRPSTRSPMMLRWISFVPPPMVCESPVR
jgi:hypothetical protein